MNRIVLAALVLTTRQFNYDRFQAGTETTVFADGAGMLADSLEGGARVADMPAGLPVTILESNGGWCLVEAGSSFCLFADGGATGWVEASDLALVSLTTSGGLFQFGIMEKDGSEPYDNPRVYGYRFAVSAGSAGPAGEARLLRENGAVLSCPVDLLPYSENGNVYYDIMATEVPAEGLTGAGTALVLSFIFSACGYINSDILMVATADELVMGPEAASVSDAGVLDRHSRIILPPELGEQDVVEILTRVNVQDSESTSSHSSEETTSLVRYSWNGCFFELEP